MLFVGHAWQFSAMLCDGINREQVSNERPTSSFINPKVFGNCKMAEVEIKEDHWMVPSNLLLVRHAYSEKNKLDDELRLKYGDNWKKLEEKFLE